MRETIPESIRIGAVDYTVDVMTPMEGMKHGLMGWCHYNSQQITYTDNLPRQRMAEVLLHEALHGIYVEHNMRVDSREGREEEEKVVEPMARGLLQLIRDNPDFIAWLSQSFSDKEVLERTAPLWAEPR